MADGRQQQDQPPQRRGSRPPGLQQPSQPSQPRRHHQHPAGSGGAGRRAGPSGSGSGSTRMQQGPVVAQQAAAAAQMTVDALMAAASDSGEPAAARAAALQQLHQRLFDPADQRAALQQLPTLWPRLLGLLLDDPAPAVTAAAAPAVGAVGALASQASAASAAAREGSGSGAQPAAAARSGSAGGLLFDWLLPVLQRRATPAGRPLAPHQLSAVLLALRDCLAGVDAVTLARYANAVLGAVQALLEDDATPPAVLPPLLGALQQAARHQHSLKPRFRDLADLLLGWALEPALPDAARPALTRALAALGAQWRQQPDFTASLLGSLLADMQRLVSKACSAAGDDAASEAGSSLRQVLTLAACVLPLLDAVAATRLPACQQHLQELLSTFRQAVLAAAAAGSPAVPPTTVAAELAGHAARLAALAPAAAAAAPAQPAAGLQQAGAHEPHVAVQLLVAGMAGLSLHEQRVQLELTVIADDASSPISSSAAAPAAAGLHRSFAAVAALAAAAAAQAPVLAQPATVLALLGALRSWLQVLQAQAMPLDDAAALLLPAAGQPGSPTSSGSGGSWLLSLRAYGSREVLLQAAQLLLPLVQHLPGALAALLADTVQLASAQREAGEAAALCFNLRLLQATVPQLPPARLASIWQCLLPAAQQQTSDASQQLLELLQVTQRQLSASGGPEASGAATAALRLLTALLTRGQEAASEPATLLALQWLQQAAEWQAPAAAASPAGSSSGSDSSLAAAMHAALTCAEAEPAAVRTAAFAALRALAGSRHGSSVLLADPSTAAALFQSALLHVSDLDPAAAAAARQVLSAAAAPLTLSGCLASADGGGGSPGAVAEAAAVALQSQQLGLRPAQLQQLLGFLAGAESPAGMLTAAGHQAALPLQQWLPRLVHSMRAVPPPSGAAADAASSASAAWRAPTCLGQAAWWAVQEAAKHCVAARLRTHWGGPAQTLAALERALQTAVGQLQLEPLPAAAAAQPGDAAEAGSSEQRQAAALLLLFTHALEQGVAAAASGSGASRAAAPQPAIAFLAANAKVCQAWFARVRPALMRAAAAAGLHELAAYHALLRLRDLQQQLQQLLPAPAPGPGSERQPSGDLAAASSSEAAPGAAEAAAAAAQTPLAGKARRISAGTGGTADAANPAAALLAATRGSPEAALRRQQPGSPAAAAQGRQLSQQQVQQAAAKVAEAAAAAAAALCALSDAEAVAGLQAYCRQAFQPLLLQLQRKQGAEGGSDEAAAPPTAAAEAAWDWLAAVREQAAGRFEAAVERYSQLYAPAGTLQCAPTPVLARLAAEAYAAVGDAGGLHDWLQTKAGSKLPAAAAARCLHLASWEALEQQPEGARGSGEALQRLRLCCLDVAACGNGGSCSLASAAGQLASLAVSDSGSSRQLCLAPEVLLHALLAGSGQQQQGLTFWHSPSSAASAPGPLAGGNSLQPLLQLLASAALTDEQRGPLLLAAARAAAAGGNGGAASRLLASAEAELAAGSSHGSVHAAAEQLLRLGELQTAAAARSGGSRDTASHALQLLLAARGSSGVAARAVVPAAAELLLGAERSQPSMTAAEAAGLMQACELPGLSSDSRNSITQLEQQLLALHQQPSGGGLAPSMRYAVLKVAVAAAPAAAQQWWQWAAWLHGLAQQQQQQQQQAATGAAFTASCRALALAGGGTDGYAALPALLALLQLLLEHSGGSLPADAAAQLTAVPAAAWLPLLPQLLAHLAAADGHGEASQAATQQLLLSLLLHVGQAAPCEVLLPAMVAAAGDPDQHAVPASPLHRLLHELRQAHPVLAQQLQTLAAEAARLAVLPEEHWHAVLQEAAATAAKRLQAHRRQAAPAAAGGGEEQPADAAMAAQAGADAYLAAMAAVLLPLQQQLQAADAAAPQTPHERRFHQQALPALRQLLQQLLEPLAAGSTSQPAPASGAASKQQAQRAVSLLRAAAAELAASVRRKQLSLPEVAPGLAALADTGIPIPGASAGAGAAGAPEQPATLAGVGAEVAVLSTKTRPKRLRFLGSDGRQHAFLLKGREDLRADARVMQVLRACRAALQAPGGCDGGSPGPAVHCFEVTPLGARLGLVQWVDGTVPLYALFPGGQQARAQQQRRLAAAAAQQQQQQQQQPAPAPAQRVQQAPGRARVLAVVKSRQAAPAAPAAAAGVGGAVGQAQQQQQLRPIDLFYAKLRAAGIDPSSPREAWPLPKLARVLESMQQTVDRQLLWRELWLGASGPADWWRRQRAFAASTAATSMVGHLLGLGDRHLDNVLLGRRGGHVVHVDHSVVFDRGLQLKVPEVVPFRLTQTIVAALGVTGVEGAFRGCCERTLGALRANAAPLASLLEAALRGGGVDWDAEGDARAASKAFAQAVALQLFALRQARAAPELASAASAAGAGLAAAGQALAAYIRQLLGAAGTAAAAAESHALLQRCQATLSTAAAQEQALAAQADEGRAALAGVLAEAQPVAAQVLAALQECQAWQQRHDALLPLLLSTPPAALLAGPTAVDPSAAVAAGAAPPLLLVSAATPDAEAGAGSLLQAALGMPPSEAPLSPSLLLSAAAVDTEGRQLLSERAAAAQQLAGALQEYAAGVACLLGGPRYAGSSQHAHWAAAFKAALDLPVPQGFQRAAELAPRCPEAGGVLAAWRPLAAAAAAAAGLAAQLSSTAAALRLERVDVSLAAADARQRMLESAEACWAGGAAGQGPAALAAAFAAFTTVQAEAVEALAAQHAQQRESDSCAPAAAQEVAALLEGMQRLVLGYASTAVAVRDATSEALFAAPGGAGAGLLGWLSQAVQAADGVSTAASELQLLLPQLLALLYSPEAAAQVSAAVAAAAEELDAAASSDDDSAEAAAVGAEERAAAAAMQPLLAAAAQHPALSALLQGLQWAQAAAQALLPAEEQPSLAQEQLLLASAVVSTWQELEGAAAAAATAAAGGGASQEGHAAEPAASEAWQPCSAALAAAVAAEVAQHLLPSLAAGLATTARQLREAAPSLAGLAGLGAPAAAAAGPDLVPFTGFDAELPGAGELLGGLEDELELELEALPAGSGAPGAAPGGSGSGQLAGPGQGAELVPFLDFDEGLAGADDLLEVLEPEFEAGPSASQQQLSQPSGLSQLSDDGGAGDGASLVAAQLSSLLAAAADASGALAAVDAVQYVSGLALAQAQHLRQQHCAELAAFQWANEHLLPPEASAAAAGLLAGGTLSAAAAAAAGAALPPLHLAAASWELRSSRRQLLERLQTGVGTLAGLQAPLAQWQQRLAGVQQELSAAVSAAAPFAATDLQQALQRQQRWLQVAAGHAANLLEISQAVLQLEAARTADAGEAAPAAAEQQQQQQLGHRYRAEQLEGWQRYTALLQRMRELHSSYAAAERGIAAAGAELQQLQLRRREATTIAESATAAGANAAASFAAAALPLVRATQQLPTAVGQLLPLLAGSGAWAEQLRSAQGWVAELAAAAAGDAAVAAAAGQAAEQLASAAGLVQELPAAASELQAALLPVRNRLLAGGRGEAAAQQQAAGVVDALSVPATRLGVQLERLAEVQRSLAALPAGLQSLAAQAAAQAAALQQQHGFSLQSLEQLLGVPASTPPAATATPAATRGLTGSLLLTGLAAGAQRAEERQQYAARVLQRFSAKLAGTAEGQPGGAPAPVEAEVTRLIAAATSPDRLARMYEGWMPWV